MTVDQTPHPSHTPATFRDHVADYALAGWPCILPVPPATKTPPPQGFTGAEGRDTDPATLVAWAGSSYAGHSIALRMPWFDQDHATLPGGWCVIGIDVDQYQKAGKQKHGAQTLAEHEQRWGPLPKTWTSTARGEGPSRIHLFRAPARRYATRLVGASTGDVEIIQRHHRYAVVWPSQHHDAQAAYTWYDPMGAASARPPRPDELEWLPIAWVDGLTEGAAGVSAASSDVGSGQGLLDQLLDDWRPECADMTSARLAALDKLTRADEGSRHDTMTERTHHLVQLAAGGHPGVAHAVLALRDAWNELTAGEDREAEFERALLTSARKAVTVVGQVQVPNDPCLLFAGAIPLPALAPGDPRAAGAGGTDSGPVDENGEPVDLHIYEPPRWAGVREAIGAAAFDPVAGLDQPLAEAVLERTYPALRYAYDADGWLLRVPDRWELRKRLSRWAVAQVAPLMPVGDPEADKGSDQFERAKRRARFMTAGGAGGIAKMMDALVSAGMHPASVALAQLDSDPEVLWAGGMPFNLRASLEGPAFAQVDVSTPHLHTAGVLPEVRPTPLWDTFLAAVWPDEAIRRWAIRVLAIAFTGYADRALPILLGDTGRGKTQVIHLLMSVLDTYGHAANPKLLAPAAKEHDTIVFDLKGRRLSFIDEAPSDAKAGQERLKQLTGGGALTGRQMNQDPITFKPTHTLVLTSNDEPLLTDAAVRSRARLIPCEGDPEAVRTARAAIGHVSGAAWRAEAPGVLAAMMAEAAAWLADPNSALTTAAPESIRYLAENLGAEQDPVTVWLNEETEPYDPGTPSRELYQAFTASCLRNNIRRDQIPSETKWGRQLGRLGYPSFHTEHGKRRQLRVSTGGFLPGMGPTPAADQTRQPNPSATSTPEANFGAAGQIPASPLGQPDGLTPNPDGLLTGSLPNPSGVFPQVNPSPSVSPDGSDGLNTPLHTCAPAPHAPESQVPTSSEPVSRLFEDEALAPASATASTGAGERPAKAKREQTDAARQTRAAKAETARLERIAEASGAEVALPAVVTRDGAVQHLDLAEADLLLASISAAAYDGTGAGELTVDVETTGYPVGHQHFALRTIQVGGEQFAVVLDAADAEHRAVAGRHLAAAPVLHAHSATADLVPLATCDVLDLEDGWDRMHDTVIPAKLADPASTGADPSLKKISAAVLGPLAVSPSADEARKALFKAGKWLNDTEVTTPLEKSGWAQVSPTAETMIRYAASDVLDDAAIARRLPPLTPELLHRERTAQRMTARIASHGIRLDGDHVDAKTAEHRAARAELAETVRRFGINNPGSAQQVGEALIARGLNLPRTPAGKPSVAKGVLEPMRDLEGEVGDLVRAVLGYRHHNTALVLLLEPYSELVHRGDGRARPTVYTLGADTGRMSCVRPNLQQVSRTGGLRACFTADPGQLMVSADFSSVELRVAAALSGDRALQTIIAEGRDVHHEIARLVWGPQAGKAERYKAKPMVFGRIYGAGVQGLARDNGVSFDVAEAVIAAMDVLTPGLSEWSRMVRDGVEVGRTQFPTYSGRVAHLPKQAPHAGPNYCIQGTARELLIDALLRWQQTPWGGSVLFPVHDELVVMVPEHEADQARAALLQCMTTELFGVPIVAEADEPSFEWKDSA